jgi:hypothetical protein
MECGFITANNLALNVCIVGLKASQNKMCSDHLCLGQLMLQLLNLNASTGFCALLFVACLIARQHAWLICVDCKWKPHKLYPTELQPLVFSQGLILYE